jgi:hypothetical protein
MFVPIINFCAKIGQISLKGDDQCEDSRTQLMALSKSYVVRGSRTDFAESYAPAATLNRMLKTMAVNVNR